MRRRQRVIVFLVLLALTSGLILRNSSVDASTGSPVKAAYVIPFGEDERWSSATWRLVSIAEVDPESIPREEWQDPVSLPRRTKVVAGVVELRPRRDWPDGDTLATCDLFLVSADRDRRWTDGSLVPTEFVPDGSVRCSADAEGTPLKPGRPYELQARYLVPASLPMEDLAIEVESSEAPFTKLRLLGDRLG